MLSYMTNLRLFLTGLCLYDISHWFQWSYTRRFGLCYILIITIWVFENMPDLILIYWCNLYHFQSRMKPGLPLEYLDLIPEPVFMKNVHLHKCSQSHWTFKGNSSFLATQLKADGQPWPKGMQIFSLEGLVMMGNKTKAARVELSGQSQQSKLVEVGQNLWKSPIQLHTQSRMLRTVSSQVLALSKHEDTTIRSLLTLICFGP